MDWTGLDWAGSTCTIAKDATMPDGDLRLYKNDRRREGKRRGEENGPSRVEEYSKVGTVPFSPTTGPGLAYVGLGTPDCRHARQRDRANREIAGFQVRPL